MNRLLLYWFSSCFVHDYEWYLNSENLAFLVLELDNVQEY
jgi:hypothetical protein